METRPLFIIGDVLANVLVAIIAIAAATWLIGGAWGMVGGMVAGMVLGSVIGLILCLLGLMLLLGAMEALTPCMMSGMLGGMWGAIWTLTGGEVLSWGTGTGLVVVAAIYGLNFVMTGPRTFEV